MECEKHDGLVDKVSKIDKEVSLNKERISNMKEDQVEMKKHLCSMDGKLDDLPAKIKNTSGGLSGKQMTGLLIIITSLIELLKQVLISKP